MEGNDNTYWLILVSKEGVYRSFLLFGIEASRKWNRNFDASKRVKKDKMWLVLPEAPHVHIR
jgi:hypothetical protein